MKKINRCMAILAIVGILVSPVCGMEDTKERRLCSPGGRYYSEKEKLIDRTSTPINDEVVLTDGKKTFRRVTQGQQGHWGAPGIEDIDDHSVYPVVNHSGRRINETFSKVSSGNFLFKSAVNSGVNLFNGDNRHNCNIVNLVAIEDKPLHVKMQQENKKQADDFDEKVDKKLKETIYPIIELYEKAKTKEEEDILLVNICKKTEQLRIEKSKSIIDSYLQQIKDKKEEERITEEVCKIEEACKITACQQLLDLYDGSADKNNLSHEIENKIAGIKDTITRDDFTLQLDNKKMTEFEKLIESWEKNPNKSDLCNTMFEIIDRINDKHIKEQLSSKICKKLDTNVKN